jgi:hypothetical protein
VKITRTEGLRKLSGRFPFGLLRWDATLLAREFEAPEVFYKWHFPKGLGSIALFGEKF